jgi:hypothetical protein
MSMIIRAPTGTGTEYTFPTPIFGYTVDYVMSTKITKTANNQNSIWDNGIAYDHAILNCTFLLDKAQANTMTTIFRTSDQARAGVIDFILPANSGFYPLGAAEHDSGTFKFVVMEYDQQATIGYPEDHFYVNLKLHETDTTHDYYVQPETFLGSLAIGDATNLRWPDNYHTPDYKINFVSQITEHDNWYQQDRMTGDQYEVELELDLYTGNMGHLIHHLTNDVRGSAVNIVPPINAYMFGRENGDGTFSCKLIQNTITQTHQLHNMWKTNLKFSLVSKVA